MAVPNGILKRDKQHTIIPNILLHDFFVRRPNPQINPGKAKINNRNPIEFPIMDVILIASKSPINSPAMGTKKFTANPIMINRKLQIMNKDPNILI